MLILLPPSEGKTAPLDGPTMDLAGLSHPTLNATRKRILAELVDLCRKDPQAASAVLGLGPKGADEVRRNAALRSQPCAPAIKVFTGVLYDALAFGSLTAAGRARAAECVLIASALFGMLRPDDLIPAYRLSGSVTLPKAGSMRSLWRKPLEQVLPDDTELVVDLRSGTYRQLAPPPASARDWLDIRVVTERAGKRITVSHDNKWTKGRIAHDLLASRATPAGGDALVTRLSRAGYRVERPSQTLIDVVID